MARRKKDRLGGVIIGPTLVLLAMVALWKNETRFDYYRAAARTPAVAFVDEAEANQAFSYTGSMNSNLEILGDYVESFRGQLVVYRTAEIYCWDRDEDDDGNVSWSLEWMSSVESNSRNSGVQQELRSKTFLPAIYRVGDLPVDSNKIQFVDARQKLNPQDLKRTSLGQRLAATPNYLVLHKRGGNELGDERVSYSAIPVPTTATYFGKYVSGRGIPDTSHERGGFINAMIQDTGILHHLVIGDRQQALATMKRHIRRLKWIVRGAGTLGVVLGFLFFFSALLNFFFHIPVIGWFAEQGAFILSLALGIPFAGLTIAAGYLAGHPLLMLLFTVLMATVAFFGYRTFKDEKSVQQSMRHKLSKLFGHEVGEEELKEQEYLQIAQLVGSKSGIGRSQEQMLDGWGRKQRWSTEKRNSMLQQAKSVSAVPNSSSAVPPVVASKPVSSRAPAASVAAEPSTDENLRGLIRLAVADGQLTAYEMRTIQSAALQAGYTKLQVREFMKSARRSADLRSNFLQSRRSD